MSRDSSRLTSGRRSTPWTTLNIAALAPMPSARVTMTVSASPLARVNDRNANFKSVTKLIGLLLHVGGGRGKMQRHHAPASADSRRILNNREMPYCDSRAIKAQQPQGVIL